MSADFDPDPVSASILAALVGSEPREWVALMDLQDHFAENGFMVADVHIHQRADDLQSSGFVEKRIQGNLATTTVRTCIRLTREGAQVAGSLYGEDEDEEEAQIQDEED